MDRRDDERARGRTYERHYKRTHRKRDKRKDGRKDKKRRQTNGQGKNIATEDQKYEYGQERTKRRTVEFTY